MTIQVARNALLALAQNPSPRRSGGVYDLVIDLYDQLRAARAAGHSWETIAKRLTDSGTPVSGGGLASTWRKIQKERRTGEY